MTPPNCVRCKTKAVIRMREHRISFCREHYLEWVRAQTEHVIEKYHMFSKEDRILLAVSGGKDSLALWDVLYHLGYPADGLYINLGITEANDYSNQSQFLTEKFAAERGLNLHVVNIPTTYGSPVPTLALRTKRGKYKPCAVCGLIKRNVMNRIAREQQYNVLLTAHNLDDETAVLLSNTFVWQSEMLLRQMPVLEEGNGFSRKAKPFCRFTERETAAYTILSGIDYITDECPYSEGSKQFLFKDILNRMEEEQPGFKLRFYVSFLNTKKQGYFVNPNPEMDKPREMFICPECGSPTSRDDICAFCATLKENIAPRKSKKTETP